MPYPPLFGYGSSVVPKAHLIVWLKGDAITGFNDGDKLTTWIDSSGNGNNFTASSIQAPVYKNTSVTINGLPVVQWNGTTGQFQLGCTSFNTNSWTGGTLYVVGRLNNDPPADFHNGGSWTFNDGWDHTTAFPFTDGIIYDATFTTVRKTTVNPTPSLTNPFYYGVLSTAGSWTNRLNGSQLFTTGTNTFNGTVATIVIGHNTAPAGDGGSQLYWDGVIAEVLAYDSALGSTDRATIETYLAAKYAI